MPSVYQLKPAFQNLLRPLVRVLARAGVSANQVTVFACVFSVGAGLGLLCCLMAEPVYNTSNPRLSLSARLGLACVPVVFLVRMALNAIDGMLAREHNMQTKLGAFLNELCDVISDTALLLPFALIGSSSVLLVPLLVVLAALTEFVGIQAQALSASRRYDGPMGKSDRAVALSVIALVLAAGVAPGSWFGVALVALCGLCVLTLINRVRRALSEVAPSIKNSGHE
jgi:CDP-diacylglycerol---glycerol-3-phosphate 3-phosphatidyltransferase